MTIHQPPSSLSTTGTSSSSVGSSRYCEEQNDLVCLNLLQFFSVEENISKMLKIITGESSISLRAVDWFVTNYAKKYFVVYVKSNGQRFNVHHEYRLKLGNYSKPRFDPFCRWERMTIPYKNNSLVQTTLGQLSFFKWAIQHEVLDYIEAHLAEINADMIRRNSLAKRAKGKAALAGKTRKKREELSTSAMKSMRKEYGPVEVSFC